MINRYTIIKSIKTEEYAKAGYTYDEKTKMVLENGEPICHIDQLTERICKKEHCNFEVIYSDCLDNTVYRCKDCGTVVFGGDDERWDPNLRCPGCGGYHCHTKWWSGEDIANDPKKQQEIEHLLKQEEEHIKYDKWYSKIRKKQEEQDKKKGRHIWRDVEDLWVYCKDFKKSIFGKTGICISLKAESRYWEGYKRLVIKWYTIRPGDNGVSYCDKWHYIPLTPKSIYHHWIIPLSPTYRKYIKEREKEWNKVGK